MHTMWDRFILVVIATSLIFVSWCWSSSSTTTSQEVFFSDYSMTINKNFISLDTNSIADRRLNGPIIAAYSMPTTLENVFEKNIIIIQDDLWVFDLEGYVNQSIGGIQKTWWWYKQLSLSSDTIQCNSKELPAFQHTFSMVRWGLNQTGQIIYFMQYFFAKEKKIIILSSSTDNKDDLDALDTYKESIRCATGAVSLP